MPMPLDREIVAEECVRQGTYFNVEPHYLLAVGQLRSGISNDDAGDKKGLFRLTQAQWDANSNDEQFDIHFTSAQISSPLRQCAVFALMTNKGFNAFVSANNHNPSAKELYLQQWPDPPPPATFEQDFLTALNATADLVGPAADKVLGDAQSVPVIHTVDQPFTELLPQDDGGTTAATGPRPKSASPETDAAIVAAAKQYGFDPNTFRAIASIESSMDPESNRNRKTQYKGLFQIGREEWATFGGGGDIYNARDNAMAFGRMTWDHAQQFRSYFGHYPSDTQLYLIHQQGLGFYTRGVMTNIAGNPYPGMHGPQTHQSFEAGWGHELMRRKAWFAKMVANEA